MAVQRTGTTSTGRPCSSRTRPSMRPRSWRALITASPVKGTRVKARTSGRGKNDEDANAENGPKVIVVEDEEEPAKKGCCVVM